jgi:hypothetical protein
MGKTNQLVNLLPSPTYNSIQLVWEDEGITVGRSVDVFMSQLRKLLDGDPTVKYECQSHTAHVDRL